MKQKITPEYVLEMLQELKKLFDEKKFNLQTFTVRYPTYFAFRKNLRLKGIIKKEYGRYKWISIEPNIIMAKELIKLYLADSRQRREEFENSKKEFYKNKSNQNQQKEIELLQEIEKTTSLKGKNTAMNLAKEIRQEGEIWTDAVKRASVIMKDGKTKEITLREPKLEELFPNSFIQDLRKEIAEKNNNIESIERIHKQLKEELIGLRAVLSNEKQDNIVYRKFFFDYGNLPKEVQDLKQSLSEKEQELTNQEVANEGLKQRLREAERGIDDNVKTLLQKNSELKETIQSREKEIENLVSKIEDIDTPLSAPTYGFPDFSEPEVSKPQEKVYTSKGSKTYKLFGIPVFSINNK